MNIARKMQKHKFFYETPLKHAKELSQYLPGREIFLKMESSQLTGSFKMRGVGHRVQKAVVGGCTHLIAASGGNAGLATAEAARLLGVQCTVYVPKTTTEKMIGRLHEKGAQVIIHGENYNAAEKKALEAAEEPGATFISSYDHPDIWEGHMSIIREIHSQLPEKPAAIVVSVGGGGLLTGVLSGLKNIGWNDVPVIAMETEGANCFNMSMKAGKIIALEKITSVATSLGARTISEHLMDISSSFNIISEVVSDKDAVSSCLMFEELEDVVVEPACGATLAALYHGVLARLDKEGHLPSGPIVLVVCGGTGVSYQQLVTWAETLP